MKTLLVNPSSKYINSHKLYRQFLPPIAPLGLAYIAAVLEANKFDVDIIDMYADRISGSELLKIIKDRKPQLIGFSVLTSVIDDVRCLVSGIRSVDKETKIVLGNTHASFFADSLLKEGLADIIVRGEGEYSMLDICKSLDNGGCLSEVRGISYRKNGDIIHNAAPVPVADIDALPSPAFHLLDLNKYKEFPLLSVSNARFLPISGSRGCNYRCYFCSQDSINKEVRYRKIGHVIDEIEYMQKRFNVGYFCFTDACFPFSEKSGLEFCDELMRRGLHKKIKWITETRVDMVSKKLLKKMKDAGLHLIIYGIEVGNQGILDKIGKKASLDDARLALKHTKESGILSLGLFMLGLPWETESSCNDTIKFARELDADIVKFNIAIPFPGSQFYKDYIGQGQIKHPEIYSSWYDSFNMGSGENFSFNNNLTYKDLVRLQKKAMISYYARPKIFLRSCLKRIITVKNILYGAYWLLFMFFSNCLINFSRKKTHPYEP